MNLVWATYSFFEYLDPLGLGFIVYSLDSPCDRRRKATKAGVVGTRWRSGTKALSRCFDILGLLQERRYDSCHALTNPLVRRFDYGSYALKACREKDAPQQRRHQPLRRTVATKTDRPNSGSEVFANQA